MPELSEYLLKRINNNQKYFHSYTLIALKRYSYHKNNIRELEGIISSAMVRSGDDPCIKPEHLNLPKTPTPVDNSFYGIIDENNLNIAYNFVSMLNTLAIKAITKHQGVKAKAAEELGISIFHLKRILNKNTSSKECLQFMLLKRMFHRQIYITS